MAVSGIASGVGAGVGMEMGDAIKSGDFNLGSSDLNTAAFYAVSGMSGAIAGAATRTLIDGTDFGDNIIATLPGVVSSIIGNVAKGEIDGSGPSADDIINKYAAEDEQSSGSQTSGQQSSTQQTGAQVNAAISHPAASAATVGQPISEATFPVETVDVVSTFIYDPDTLAQYWAINPDQHPNSELITRLGALNAPASAYGPANANGANV